MIQLRGGGDPREDEADQLDLSADARRRTIRIGLATCAFILLVIGIAFFQAGSSLANDPILIALALFYAAMLVWTGYVRPRREARERARSWSTRWRAPTYRFDAAGIHVEDDGAHAYLPWSHVASLTQTQRLLLITTRQELMMWLPKRALTDEQRERILAWAAAGRAAK